MELFIQVENGQTVNHPALKDNLIQAFQRVPENWEPFERVLRPEIGPYQILESETPTYQKIDGVWKDVWAVRDMTDAEKAAKQQEVKDRWNSVPREGYAATFVFDEQLCAFVPPKA